MKCLHFNKGREIFHDFFMISQNFLMISEEKFSCTLSRSNCQDFLSSVYLPHHSCVMPKYCAMRLVIT